MKTVPDDYSVEGLEASNHSDPGGLNEAVDYTTPNGTKFALAKDFLGIQFCMNGCLWPPSITTFPSMTAAVDCLRRSTAEAIEFFEKTRAVLDVQRNAQTLKRREFSTMPEKRYENYPLYIYVIGGQKALLHQGNAKTPEEAMEELQHIVEDAPVVLVEDAPVVRMVLEVKDCKMFKFAEVDDRTYCPACGKIDLGEHKCECTR